MGILVNGRCLTSMGKVLDPVSSVINKQIIDLELLQIQLEE